MSDDPSTSDLSASALAAAQKENAYLRARVAQLTEDVTALSAENNRMSQERERLHGRMQDRAANPLSGGQ